MRVLILNFATLKKDPRVFRQVEYYLSRGHKVTCLWYQEHPSKEIEQITLPSSFLRYRKMVHYPLRLFNRFYWSQPHVQFAQNAIEGRTFDLVIANDADTLPLAEKIKKESTLLFDAHEYAPAEWEEFTHWRVLIKPYVLWCLKALKSVDMMTTICEGIRLEYKQNFGIDSTIITNACKYFNLKPKPVGKKIRMIYTGLAHPGRHIDQVIHLFNKLDERFTLDLILVPGIAQVIEEIKELAKDNKRIRFLDPLPMEEIVPFCNDYDMGFFPLPASNRNVQHALPNKFFEFIQARLCLAISPLHEMERLMNKYECGVIATEEMNKLTFEEIQTKKENSALAAHELSEESNQDALDLLFSRRSLHLSFKSDSRRNR